MNVYIYIYMGSLIPSFTAKNLGFWSLLRSEATRKFVQHEVIPVKPMDQMEFFTRWQKRPFSVHDTVDGRNPAPPGIDKTP